MSSAQADYRTRHGHPLVSMQRAVFEEPTFGPMIRVAIVPQSEKGRRLSVATMFPEHARVRVDSMLKIIHGLAPLPVTDDQIEPAPKC